ncbi:hypothetical protein [Xanthomonas albilineans]|uniref:hypothetical protein n=1 Tax=Xanthomonas albilineans TaxID=29447 RepID=UPI001E5E866E|nr:hypothetical protein [Xanthomonas albilineans]
MALEAKTVASSAVKAIKLEKALASEAQLAKILAGEGRVLAGAGSKKALRTADRLAAQYGGEASNWSKVTGGNHIARDGTNIETHAYENKVTRDIVEPKTKLVNEGQ